MLFASQLTTVLGVLAHLVLLVILDWNVKRLNAFLIQTVLRQQFVSTINVPLVSMVLQLVDQMLDVAQRNLVSHFNVLTHVGLVEFVVKTRFVKLLTINQFVPVMSHSPVIL